jgi:hypothetical protein
VTGPPGIGGRPVPPWKYGCNKESTLENCLIIAVETAPVAALRRPYLELTVVPLPGALWLMGSVVIGLAGLARRRAGP